MPLACVFFPKTIIGGLAALHSKSAKDADFGRKQLCGLAMIMNHQTCPCLVLHGKECLNLSPNPTKCKIPVRTMKLYNCK